MTAEVLDGEGPGGRRILLRAGKSPLIALTHEQSLAVGWSGVFASNSGNMLFYSSVHRALSTPDAEVVPDGYRYERGDKASQRVIDEVNERYDHYVVPMANAYRKDYRPSLERITHVIERLKIPVTVIGIGAQMPKGKPVSDLNPDLREPFTRFTRAVLKRSPSIGVRGEYTVDLLKSLGFDDDEIVVTGCPSMFSHGITPPMRPKTDALGARSRVALNFTPRVPGMAQFLNRITQTYENSVVIPQQQELLALMLWGEDSRRGEDDALPVNVDHPLYQQDRMRFFVDAEPWFDYLRGFDFVVGTRLHGCAAGVLSGTPTLLLAHDSRTVELAEYHGLPYRLFSDLPDDVSLEQLYDGFDQSRFEAVQAETFQRYTDFLDSHGLPHVFDSRHENPHYDEELARANLPGPAHTLMADGELGRRQLIDRLSWLRQGRSGDASRPTYAYVPPVAGRPTRLDLPQQAKRVDRLGKDLADDRKTIDHLQGELHRMREQLGRLEAEVERLTRQIDEQHKGAQRLERAVRRDLKGVHRDLREVRAVRRRARRVVRLGKKGYAESARRMGLGSPPSGDDT